MTIDTFAEQAGLVRRSMSIDNNAPAEQQYRIEMSRDYGYPIDDVWSAWTDPRRLARWLGEPRGELRIGGIVELVMSPPDGDIAQLEILTCQAPRALSATWSGSWDTDERPRRSGSHCSPPPPTAPHSRWSICYSTAAPPSPTEPVGKSFWRCWPRRSPDAARPILATIAARWSPH